jgi:TolB-like protein
MKKTIFTTLILILCTLSLQSQDKMRIAIIDFEARDISKRDAIKISELIRNEMINIGKYVIIERAQMGNILKEQGLQQTGCTDVSCAVEMGKMLSAKKMLVGSIMKLGNDIIITGRIVDVEKGVAEFSEKAVKGKDASLYNTVSAFTEKLSSKIQNEEPSFIAGIFDSKSESNPYSLRAFGLTGLGFVSFGSGFSYNIPIDKYRSDYDSTYIDYKAASTTAEADTLRSELSDLKSDADSATLYRNISYGISGISLAIGGYYLYRYFTYSPGSPVSVNSDKTEIIPLLYSNSGSLNSYNSRDRYSFGGGIMIRF